MTRHGDGPKQGKGDRDRGSGSLLVLAVVMVLLTATVGVIVLGSAYHASGRASAAADLAAVAGAQTLTYGASDTEVCGQAREIALANGADLADCQVSRVVGAPGVSVIVEVPVPIPGIPPVQVRAQAGPVCCPDEVR